MKEKRKKFIEICSDLSEHIYYSLFPHCSLLVTRPYLNLLFLFFNFSFLTFLHAERISTQRIAFVDVKKVYEKYPLKELAEREIELKKENLKQKIKEIDEKIRQIEIKKMEQKTPIVSTGTVPEVSTATLKTSTTTVKVDYDEEIFNLKKQKEELSRKTLSEIEALRKDYKMQLMGNIYDAIEKVARKRGFDVVVDKSDILYGLPSTDLTNEVLKYLEK
ncbi:MAG: OmpH family outer membrane protein [Elusimicrobia bacterium]|nr:OmpH family outer membrane protein [Elusimicrobiota bacterium]